MKRALLAFGTLIGLASCSSVETKNEFTLAPGEARTFSFTGRPAKRVTVDVTSGKVEVVFKVWDKGVLKTLRTTSVSSDMPIEEVVVTATTQATGCMRVAEDR